MIGYSIAVMIFILIVLIIYKVKVVPKWKPQTNEEWGNECYKGEGRCLSKKCEWGDCNMRNKDYSPIKHFHGY